MKIERISAIYDEISSYSIELEADPTVLGPQYLGSVIAKCRNFLNRTTSVLLEIRREKHMTSNRLAGEKAAFKIESDELLATDDRVRTRPNIKDREAIINVILKERVSTIHSLEDDIRNLDAIESAVKVRHTELVRTDGQIKTQRSLIRDELDTKSFYGDEENARSKASDIDTDELDALMSGGTPTPTPSAPAPSMTLFTPPEPEAPAPVEEPVESTPEAVIAAPEPVSEPEKPKAVEIDVDSALAMAEAAVAEAAPAQEEAPAADSEEDDSAAMKAFLSGEPAKLVKEPKKKATGRKAAAAVEETQSVPTVSGDPDFDDILASIG